MNHTILWVWNDMSASKWPFSFLGEFSLNAKRLTQILWDELLTAVHDEDPSDVQLDVILLFLVLEEVEGGTARDEEKSAKLQLTLHREMLKDRA